MSDFTSSFWSVFVALVSLVSIVGCGVLLWAQSTKRPPKEQKAGLHGHVWDGDLQEYNNPLPRWWMWLFYITIVFALAYLIYYPGLGSFRGTSAWTSTGEHQAEVAQAEAQYGPLFNQYLKTDLAARMTILTEANTRAIHGTERVTAVELADGTMMKADLVVMAEDARIGYMPARVWGCPTTAMWVYRLGAEKAKRMLLTGDTVDGREAKKMGLVYDAVPAKKLDAAVDALAARMSGVPKNQLMMQKLMINQAYENMGIANTQMVATLFDGITRHSPEGVWFKEYAETHGFHEAVAWRDSGKPIPEGKSAVPKAKRKKS